MPFITLKFVMTIHIKNNIVKKYFLSRNISLFYNELYWLEKLKKYKFIPKIIDVDYKNYVISLSYVGEKISNYNSPKNWSNQLKRILYHLKKIIVFIQT